MNIVLLCEITLQHNKGIRCNGIGIGNILRNFTFKIPQFTFPVWIRFLERSVGNKVNSQSLNIFDGSLKSDCIEC